VRTQLPAAHRRLPRDRAVCSGAIIHVLRAPRALAVSVTLCVLLWARPGAKNAVIAYEDQVLDFVPEHGGRVLQRARSDGCGGQPLEIQLFEFPSAEALDGYLTDERRTSLADQRDQAIGRTEIINVELIQPG